MAVTESKGGGRRSLPPRDARYSGALLAILTLGGGLGLYAQHPLGLMGAVLGLSCSALVLFNWTWWRVPIFPYDRILSAHSDDGLVWRREAGVRLDVGGVHNNRQVYSPWVVAIPSGWRMYYRAGGYDSVIARASSADGLSWREEPGVCVAPGALGLHRVDGPCVLRGTAGWTMFFAGNDGRHWRIYRSQSQDGIAWDPGEVCIDGTDRDGGVLHPCVLACHEGYRAYYTRVGSSGEANFSTAYSPDGTHWGDEEACTGIGLPGYAMRNPHVRREEGGGWALLFSEYSGAIVGARIASARSDDGINWRRDEGVRLSCGDGCDRHGLFCPQVVSVGRGLRVYYGGYWGRHLLEPYTVWSHGRMADRRKRER